MKFHEEMFDAVERMMTKKSGVDVSEDAKRLRKRQDWRMERKQNRSEKFSFKHATQS